MGFQYDGSHRDIMAIQNMSFLEKRFLVESGPLSKPYMV